ncbi:MAG: PRC-barrel domain containing protein [Microvirga sp.]|nr:PRC-barrel domain containing protein [Microvirga sp.]
MQNISAGPGTAESTSTTSASGIATDETEELISSNKVEGTAVYNRKGERLGTVSSLMVNKFTGQVVYTIMSFGGFLGIGQRCHPLPWKVLTYDTKLGGYGQS